MRIWRYQSASRGGQPRVAIGSGGRQPVDLLDAWLAAHANDGEPPSWTTSVAALIEAGPNAWQEAEQTAAATSNEPIAEATPGFRWLCPLDRLASLRDFLAFEDHVRRGAARRGVPVPAYWYEAPVYYKGNHRQVIGPGDICPWPRYSEHLDFELELAMVVGRAGRDLDPMAAADHIFGFTILDDFSARDVQAKESTTWLGPAKAKDFCTALGPCIVTADELGPQPDLGMACRVNGEEWGRGRSAPGGCCGLDLGRRLAPGDVVELEIERIGVLRNVIGTPFQIQTAARRFTE